MEHMFDRARWRLTAWYLAILTLIVGILSLALYHILVRIPPESVAATQPAYNPIVGWLAELPDQTLAINLIAVDAGVLVLAALGAFVLAGRTLRPIAEAMARQQRFAAAASHQLRTPLTVLQGTMEVALLRQRSPAEYEEALRTAVAEVERLSGLVADLLAVARADQDRDALRLGDVDLRAVATQAVAEVRSVAADAGQALELVAEEPLCLRGDAVKLRQAISILLENAVTYTPPGGVIRVVVRAERGRALLEVHDTGPGIAPEHLPRLFEWFYRVDPAADTGRGHLGLGLAMAAWIAETHGGAIDVASTPGAGSVFTIALPLAGKRRLPGLPGNLGLPRGAAR